MKEIETSVGELQKALFDGGEENYEYFDEISGEWKELKDSYYFERNKGFPVPEKAEEPITTYQIYDSLSETMIILGLRNWKHESDYNNKFNFPIKYIKCKDEIHLHRTYLEIFKKLDPLIIYAYNGSGFDFPYIHNRLKKLNLDVNKLSNYGSVSYSEGEFQGRKEFKFNANGHFYIDMMDVYKKFTFKPVPSYKLDTIAEIELKENKVQHTEYAAFDDFYTGKYIIPSNPTEEQKNSKIYHEAINGNWDEVKELAHSEFVYYGIKDAYLVKRLDDKKNFTSLMLMIAEKMGVQLSDSMGTVKPWSQYLLNKAHLNKQIMPPRQEHSQPSVVGGFVQDPERGKHKWILSADVNSMYPLLGMVGFNMSPETFIPKHQLPNTLRDLILTYFNNQNEQERFNLDESVWNAIHNELIEHNMSLGINGAVFSKEKLGMIPELVQEIYNSRKQAKKVMFNFEQRKILIKEILKGKHE